MADHATEKEDHPRDVLDEKKEHHDPEGVPLEEDEDIDALIDDLESDDGHVLEEEEEVAPGASAKPVPEELLNTDTRTGLTSEQVDARRRKYGLNQMSEEKENLVLKFLMFFVGPIQFVMEVSPSLSPDAIRANIARLLLFWLPVSRIGLTLVLFAVCSCSTLSSVSSRNSRLAPLLPSSRRLLPSRLLFSVMVVSLRLMLLRLFLAIFSRSRR